MRSFYTWAALEQRDAGEEPPDKAEQSYDERPHRGTLPSARLL